VRSTRAAEAVAELGSLGRYTHVMKKHITILSIITASLIGCGKQADKMADKAGDAVGQHLTEFTKGIGKGIDKKMMVDVAVKPEVYALGLTNTFAKSLGLDEHKKGFTVYFMASQSVSNTLVVRAFNADGLEIGRTKKQIVMEKDDAKYVTFEFDSQMDSQMVKQYGIGL
jgi:hypothetical protein